MIDSETAFCQEREPPVTVGAVGAVRSMLTVFPAPGDAGAQAEILPETSVARNCTSVVPAAVTLTPLPAAGDVHVVPPFADVRYWYVATPEPGESVAPEPVTVTDAAFVHESEPPETAGAVGALRSILAVFVAPPVPGFHAEALPALSTLRNSVSVPPSP